VSPTLRPVRWQDGSILILDQTRLPEEEAFLDCRTLDSVNDAIGRLAVRGAPLLGVTAAYGLALAARVSAAKGAKGMHRDLRIAGRALVATRPTAVNIAWAVDRVLAAVADASGLDELRERVLAEAETIEREDAQAAQAMGELGAELVPETARILTHCNTGHLVSAGIGTAQGVIETAHTSGKRVHVWVDETRPLLQGARLTAWELQRLGIPMTLVTDNAAASLMSAGEIDMVITGADRIAANGDTANKVGTYALAVAARHHGLPFYVAAPLSTVDPGTASGSEIEIERREPDEVLAPRGVPFAPEGTPAYNPAFDVTPGALISGIVTEAGVARPPYRQSLRRLRRAV
jgi:methylthioribose-1-phosphate isomerase